MTKRINIVLPAETLAVLDRAAAKGNRSRFIDRAVRHYIETQGRESLRERLKREAIENAKRDLSIAADWFPLEEEAWRTFEVSVKAKKPAKTKRS